jgi:hypothetical protein
MIFAYLRKFPLETISRKANSDKPGYNSDDEADPKHGKDSLDP